MILHELMPVYQFSEQHGAATQARPDLVYRSIITLDLSQSALVKLLYALRRMPRTSLTLAGMSEIGFKQLGADEGREVVVGIIGRLWKSKPEIVDVSPEGFRSFAEPGYAKAAFNFSIEGLSGGCKLSTETRVFCTSPGARRAFLPYWALIRPFSGLIRKAMLKTVVRSAERSAAAPLPP